MAVKTSNYYGRLTISDTAIAMTAYYAALDCYGVVDLVSRSFSDSLKELFNKTAIGRGVKVATLNNVINLELFVILQEGVNIDAVKESIESTVKYNVGLYTGMRVDKVVINVVGVRVETEIRYEGIKLRWSY